MSDLEDAEQSVDPPRAVLQAKVERPKPSEVPLDLVYQSASRSPGSTQHYLEALKVLHHSQDIVVCGADGRVRRPAKNYSLSDVIEHSRRIRLI